MAKYDHGGGCPCGLYAECDPGCRNHPSFDRRRLSGANGMRFGDRVACVATGRLGTAGEFLQDGDVDVSWDDGTGGTVRWREIMPAASVNPDADCIAAAKWRALVKALPGGEADVSRALTLLASR